MAAVFRPREIISTLAAHDVRCVLIGGLAAVLHGSPATTNDADVCPARDRDNLERLAAALRALAARVRFDGDADGLEFDCSAEFLATVDVVNLSTRFGDLDIAFKPAGYPGFDALAKGAVPFDIDGTEILVASLDDVIRSKTMADRPKDRAVLPVLLALRDEIEARRDDHRDDV
jgi:hypothetical protein